MSDHKNRFLDGTIFTFLVALFSIMFVLGATSTIWQIVSKNNNGGTPTAFNFSEFSTDGHYYTFRYCDINEVDVGDLVLYDRSAQSGVVTLSVGTLKEIRDDNDFGEMVVFDTLTNEEIVRPITFFLGQKTGEDYFSYILVGLLNDQIMLYLFTIFPAVVLVCLLFYYKRTHQTQQKQPKSKRAKKLASIANSNK